MLKKIPVFVFLLCVAFSAAGQLPDVDYATPKEYEINEITVGGVKYLNHNALVQLSGLQEGETIEIPGDRVSRAIDKLWDHGLFSDVQISATAADSGKINLHIYLQERPRLSKIYYFIKYKGKKEKVMQGAEQEDIEEIITLRLGGQVTDNNISTTIHNIRQYYREKGFFYADVEIRQRNDSNVINGVQAFIHINTKQKVRVNEINVQGNTVLKEAKVEKAMENTHERSLRNLFRTAKYQGDLFEEDLDKIVEKYNKLGYRDAKIASYSVDSVSPDRVNIDIKIDEGKQYFFGNFTWVGNTKYSSEQLSSLLKIDKGDVFDQELLMNRLQYEQDAVSNLYLDDGYLFFNVTPIETNVENDTIDILMRIYEGQQATVSRVTIAGNTKTNEHVIRRELRTLPGELFSKSDITRSIRELANLGHFDPEKLDVQPMPNHQNGTVDLKYVVEERANDQIEISGGWGAGMVIGTIGLKFNNFSARRVFKKEAWRPIPSGDGQQMSLRVQSNGTRYQSYSISFTEPWLGGKKPNSLSVSLYHTIQSNGYQRDDERRTEIQISGASVGFGRRLRWPDDYFTLYHSISYQRYALDDWPYFLISEGTSNNFSFSTVFGRNSIDNPLYTRRGSSFSLGLQITPPYSLINGKDYAALSQDDRYRWIEYHKWTFKADWYTKLFPQLDFVLFTRFHFGYLGYFNENARSPFEGFNLGGDGMTGYSMYGRETIALRGYDNGSLTPSNGGNLYSKFTLELRYPLSLNPQATIYGLAFLEAGNAWYEFEDYNPFNLNRSAGLGVRIFLPMLGLMGIDWGYGFDPIPGQPNSKWGSQFHFVLGQQF